MQDAENNTELRAVFGIDEAQALLYETGFTKALLHLAMEDKNAISSILVNYHCMTKVKATMDQYIEGLECLGLLHHIHADPLKWKMYFVDAGVAVDAGMM